MYMYRYPLGVYRSGNETKIILIHAYIGSIIVFVRRQKVVRCGEFLGRDTALLLQTAGHKRACTKWGLSNSS